MHLADLGIGVAHPMGYAPVSKVLSTYTRVEVLAVPLAQPEDVLVIRRGQPQVGLHHQHRHPHHARPERVVVLNQRGVAQNWVAHTNGKSLLCTRRSTQNTTCTNISTNKSQ